MLCAGLFRGALCILKNPGVLLNACLYSVPGFRFQHFLLIFFKKYTYLSVKMNWNQYDFFFHLFPLYRRRISKERKYVLTGIFNGKIWYHFNRITSPFSVACCDGKGRGDQIDIIYPFGNSRESLHNFSTLSYEYFFMSFAMQNPGRLFIFGRVLKPEAIEGSFKTEKILDFIQVAWV